jgi:hypothetical protein
MSSSGMLHHVAFVRTDVSEELTRATRRNIPEDGIFHRNDCAATLARPTSNLPNLTMDQGGVSKSKGIEPRSIKGTAEQQVHEVTAD